MDEIRKELEKVVLDRLKQTSGSEDKENRLAYKEAMEGLDHLLQLEKNEVAKEEFKLKTELDKDSQKKNRLIKYIEIGAPLVILLLDAGFKMHFMRKICMFEKDYTFTTTPGRSLSGLFKFKR